MNEELDEEEWYDKDSFKDTIYDALKLEEELEEDSIEEWIDIPNELFENDSKNLKPVSIIDNKFAKAFTSSWKYWDSLKDEARLVEGMVLAEWDINKAMELANIKQKATAERLLDKIATRKEFIGKLWDKWDILKKAADRVHDLLDNPNWKAYKAWVDMVLKFTWLDKPDEGTLSENSWEDVVKTYNRGIRDGKLEKEKNKAIDITPWEKENVVQWEYFIPEYDVEEPPIPESVKKQIEDDEKLGQSLFWETI